jgi:hypothetical protein
MSDTRGVDISGELGNLRETRENLGELVDTRGISGKNMETGRNLGKI